jgi:hypothetical protein
MRCKQLAMEIHSENINSWIGEESLTLLAYQGLDERKINQSNFNLFADLQHSLQDLPSSEGSERSPSRFADQFIC